MSESLESTGRCGEAQAEAASVDDVIESLLASRPNIHTRRAYRGDLNDFFRSRYGLDPTPALAREFLSQTPERLAFALAVYKSELAARGMSEATINRRLAAVKALVDHARGLGITDAHVSRMVPGVKTVPYGGATGIPAADVRRLLRQPDRSTVKGKRDYALLLLLLENALRSAEVRRIRVGDFSVADRTLLVHNRGRDDSREVVVLTAHAAAAITDYLRACDHAEDPDAFLFQACHPAGRGKALSGDGLYKVVNDYVASAGLAESVSPHRLRNTAIRTALAATRGDVAVVQQLSRHARQESVERMQERYAGAQARVSELIAARYGVDRDAENEGGRE